MKARFLFLCRILRANAFIRTATFTVLGVTAFLVAGCNRRAHVHADSDDHGAEGEHEHEQITAQITVWTNGWEIFAEHQAPVAGKPTTFVTHVTDLQTLEPRREGPAKFILHPETGLPVEHLQAAPARAGIYLPALKFPSHGHWRVQLVVDEKIVALGTVTVHSNEHAAAHAELPETPAGVTFLKEQQWKIRSGTGMVGRRTLVERVRVAATVAARPGLLASVTAPIAGHLLAPERHALPVIGDAVEKGETMALLQPSFSEVGARIIEADATVERARLALEQAEIAFKRMEQLGKAEARTQREVQEAEFALKTAQANHTAALSLQATFRSATGGLAIKTNSGQRVLEIKAPIAGRVVSQNSVAVGEYVSAERALFTVLDDRTVFLQGQVPETATRRLSSGLSATYERLAEPGVFHPIFSHAQGRLVTFGLLVAPQTRTLPLVYELPNPDGRLRVGEMISLHVETTASTNVLAVPDSALVEEDGQPVAFVQLAGETFEKRTLGIGVRDGNWVEIRSGLAEGERVVTSGAYAIRLASVSAVIPAHGHAH